MIVLPSYHGGIPMAILEAMACGKAIVSTPVSAIPEVVCDENGILIQPIDIHAWLKRIQRRSGEMYVCVQHEKERMGIQYGIYMESMRQALG